MTTTRTTTRSIARIALLAGAFAGLTIGVAAHPASAAPHGGGGGVISVDPCLLNPEACAPTLPPVITLPPDVTPPTVDPSIPPVVVDPGDHGDPPPCQPGDCIPDDECGSNPEPSAVCTPDPGHPDPETPPVVKIDPPVVAHPTFTG